MYGAPSSRNPWKDVLDRYRVQILVRRNPAPLLWNTMFCLAAVNLLALTARQDSAERSVVYPLWDRLSGAASYTVSYGRYGPRLLILAHCSTISLTQAFGIDIADLADRSAITHTMLLTAMAFKWVLSDALPALPYLTYMDIYVIITFMLLTFQGVFFWCIAEWDRFYCTSVGQNWFQAMDDYRQHWLGTLVDDKPVKILQNTFSDQTHGRVHSYGPNSHSCVALCNF